MQHHSAIQSTPIMIALKKTYPLRCLPIDVAQNAWLALGQLLSHARALPHSLVTLSRTLSVPPAAHAPTCAAFLSQEIALCAGLFEGLTEWLGKQVYMRPKVSSGHCDWQGSEHASSRAAGLHKVANMMRLSAPRERGSCGSCTSAERSPEALLGSTCMHTLLHAEGCHSLRHAFCKRNILHVIYPSWCLRRSALAAAGPETRLDFKV